MERIKQQYLTIGGERRGEFTVVLMQGNRFGESPLRTVKRGIDTYADARAEAERLAGELGVKLGRNFTEAEWAGKMKATVDNNN